MQIRIQIRIIEGSWIVIRLRVKQNREIKARVADPDSHEFWKLDTDPQYSEERDPDPH